MAVEVLLRLDAYSFVISPGSRSTPLTLAAARNPKAKTTVVLDEQRRLCGIRDGQAQSASCRFDLHLGLGIGAVLSRRGGSGHERDALGDSFR